MKEELDPTRCSFLVGHYAGGWMHKLTQCVRKWKITRDGKKYCRQHDPEQVKAREREQDRHFEFDMAQQAFGWYGIGLYDVLSEILRDGLTPVALKHARKVLVELRGYRETVHRGKN